MQRTSVFSCTNRVRFNIILSWSWQEEFVKSMEIISRNHRGIFIKFSTPPFATIDGESSHFKSLEQFIVILYDRTSTIESVNEARRKLFSKSDRSLENLPPTKKMHLYNMSNDALTKLEFGLQHVR